MSKRIGGLKMSHNEDNKETSKQKAIIKVKKEVSLTSCLIIFIARWTIQRLLMAPWWWQDFAIRRHGRGGVRGGNKKRLDTPSDDAVVTVTCWEMCYRKYSTVSKHLLPATSLGTVVSMLGVNTTQFNLKNWNIIDVRSGVESKF